MRRERKIKGWEELLNPRVGQKKMVEGKKAQKFRCFLIIDAKPKQRKWQICNFHDLWPEGLVRPMKVWLINRYSWFQPYSLPDFEMRVLQKIWWSFEPLLHELDKWLDLSIKSDLGFVTCNMQPLLGLSWIRILWAASSPLPGRGKWDSLSPAPPRE